MVEVIHIASDVSEIYRIYSEGSIILHVINVCPLGVERDLIETIVLNDLAIFIQISVAIFALMPSKGPLGH